MDFKSSAPRVFGRFSDSFSDVCVLGVWRGLTHWWNFNDEWSDSVGVADAEYAVCGNVIPSWLPFATTLKQKK